MNWLLTGILIGQISVIDGDTIRVDKLKVRLWGLDASELNSSEGVKAKTALLQFISKGTIMCQPTGDVSYDRIVAKCYLNDVDIADWMIRNGHAKPYCKYSGDYYNEAAKSSGDSLC